MKLAIAIMLVALGTSCGSDDDGPQLEFTEADLMLMHGGSEKNWHVKEVYLDYGDNERSISEACHQDDIYTFKANTREVTVTFGETACYWTEPDDEGASVLYTYYPENGQFFLDHGRGEAKGAETASVFYIMKLREISEDRMLFFNGTEENPGSAILFEAMN
ncbi:MAG: hypothetical protein HEP71_23540 [Roseivirga sp.]|nr:hypothetical protein [Roseivirga sp.]